ncbi:pentapeptide repeat-containing protein [Halococcus salsus]|uniref:pentapeptide repeat-containing protein n=1 Tax=Halococcus salsus TaxID=2162894 RepID=UPI001358660E|nr:pentapeptide repeat-containing protein [Halococcus salsus]
MATEGRCGYEQPVITKEDVGAVCCWRPIWETHERCIWHADETGKPRGAFEDHPPERDERLDGAVLRGAFLTDMDWLVGGTLIGADFSDAIIREADLAGADLRRANFRNADARSANFTDANVEDAEFVHTQIQGANFEGALFDRALFQGAHADRYTTFGDRVADETVLKGSGNEFVVAAEQAVWAYKELERLFGENALPEIERQYYLREKDLRRRIAWARSHYARALRLEGARWVTGYGTSPVRVIISSFVLIVVSALLYPFTVGIREPATGTVIAYWSGGPTTMPLGELLSTLFVSLYFSVITFGTLGYGDIQPVGTAARALASIESLLGALLLALLVYVLTRTL